MTADWGPNLKDQMTLNIVQVFPQMIVGFLRTYGAWRKAPIVVFHFVILSFLWLSCQHTKDGLGAVSDMTRRNLGGR